MERQSLRNSKPTKIAMESKESLNKECLMIRGIKLSKKKEVMTFNKPITTTILMKKKLLNSINHGKVSINNLISLISITVI